MEPTRAAYWEYSHNRRSSRTTRPWKLERKGCGFPSRPARLGSYLRLSRLWRAALYRIHIQDPILNRPRTQARGLRCNMSQECQHRRQTLMPQLELAPRGPTNRPQRAPALLYQLTILCHTTVVVPKIHAPHSEEGMGEAHRITVACLSSLTGGRKPGPASRGSAWRSRERWG